MVLIIVGVRENGNEYEKTGITEEHLDTYDPDTMAELINKYASPNLAPLVITHTDPEGLKYLCLVIDPFDRVPTICKKQHQDERLYLGRVYIRSTGKIESRPIENEAEMRELIDVASQNIARDIAQRGRDAGLVYPQVQQQATRTEEDEERVAKIKERLRMRRDEMAKRLEEEIGDI